MPKGAAPPLIEIRRLNLYWHPAIPFIQDLSLRIMEGEKIALVGPSGAGKSSLAGVLAGLTPLHSSELSLSARKRHIEKKGRIATGQALPPLIHHHSYSALARALIFQDARATLNPLMKVAQQLRRSIMRQSLPRAELERRFAVLWQEVDLRAPLADRLYPHQFSGGMCQRAVIAMALASHAALIIADEPTKALDGGAEQRIVDLLLQVLLHRGSTLLLITHDIVLAHTLCERILVMEGGAIVERYRVADRRRQRASPTRKALWHAAEQLLTQPPTPPALSRVERRTLPLIEVSHLSYRYHNRWQPNRAVHPPLLRDINLTIAPQECVGLQGLSGSGKSTLLELMAQLKTPDGGEILFQGKRIATMSLQERRALRHSIQIIFQDPSSSLNPRQRVIEIIAEPLRIRKRGESHAPTMPYRAAQQRAYLAMQQVGLAEDYAGRYPHQLSGGEQQRVLIARAIMLEPRLILADEPLSTLDTIHQHKIVTLFQKLQQELHIAFFIVSHHIERLQSLCTRSYLLENGKIRELHFKEMVALSPPVLVTHGALNSAEQ